MIVAAELFGGFAHDRQDAAGSSPMQPATTQPAASQPASQPAAAVEKLTIANEQFSLEIAADDASREKGLMGRDVIAEHGGMLFIFPQPDRQYFWMKDCPIDIDILFVDAKGMIAATHAMKAEAAKREDESEDSYENRLARYDSRVPVQFAIELKAGTIKRLHLRPGWLIAIDVARLAALAKTLDQ